jgi:hypothetical protein
MIRYFAFAFVLLAMLLASTITHAQQGNLPVPVQKLPAYPPVVCVTTDWRSEPCEGRGEQAKNPCRPEQSFRNGICWDSVIVPPPPGLPIPSQFHGKWCWQHYRGEDKNKYTYGRQAPLSGCYEMMVRKHALVIYDPAGTMQCEPLEIIVGNDNGYQFKGKCVFFGKRSVEDLKNLEGTAWIQDGNLLIDLDGPPPPVKCLKPDGTEEPCESRHAEPLSPEERYRAWRGEEPRQDRPPSMSPPVRQWPDALPGIKVVAGTPPTVMVLGNGGGVLDTFKTEWRTHALDGAMVEIWGLCGSGCTTVMTYIPKERLCFGPQGKLGFHQARYNTAKGPTAPEVTQRMFDNYPAEIQRWISAHGGPKELPSEGYLYLSASELWEMGYRKCSY